MKPLPVFVGLAVLTLAAIVGLTYDRWSRPGQVGKTLEGLPVNIDAGKATSVAQKSTAEPAPATGATKTEPAAPAAGGTTGGQQTEEQKTAAVSQDETKAAEPAAPQPAEPATPDTADSGAPTFDVVRVEPDGGAVIAGRSRPDAEVEVKIDGESLGTAKANAQGEWLVVPDKAIGKGSHEITVAEKGTAGDSGQKVVMTMPEDDGKQPLVVLSEPGEPSKVLQKPEQTDQTAAAGTEATPPAAAGTTVADGTAPAQPTTGDETPAKPAVSSTLALSAVDYDDKGDILFSGKAAPGTTVRIYVDNTHVGDAEVDADGNWVYRGRKEVAPGQHALRADQLTATGSVASRIELPFFRADPEKVAELIGSRATSPAGGEATSTEPAQTGAVATQEATEDAAAKPAAQGTETAAAAPAETTQDQATTAGEMTDAKSPGAETEAPSQGRVVIQPGNNLWNIARVVYGHGVQYSTIFEANREQIRNPDLIYPGQIFTTPGVTPPEEIDPRRRKPLTAEETGGQGAQTQ